MKNELKEETQKLMGQMLDLDVPKIPIIVGKWKKMVTLKKSTKTELDIEDIGLEDEKKAAPAAAKKGDLVN